MNYEIFKNGVEYLTELRESSLKIAEKYNVGNPAEDFYFHHWETDDTLISIRTYKNVYCRWEWKLTIYRRNPITRSINFDNEESYTGSSPEGIWAEYIKK